MGALPAWQSQPTIRTPLYVVVAAACFAAASATALCQPVDTDGKTVNSGIEYESCNEPLKQRALAAAKAG